MIEPYQYQDVPDDQLLQLEKRTLRRELDTLLRAEIPQTWCLIQEHLQRAIRVLSVDSGDQLNSATAATITTQKPGTALTPLQLQIPSSSNNDGAIINTRPLEEVDVTFFNGAIRGLVKIRGYHITHINVVVKGVGKHHRGQSFELTLRPPHEPYLLTQLQRAHHLAHEALMQLQSLNVARLCSNYSKSCASDSVGSAGSAGSSSAAAVVDPTPIVGALIKSLEDALTTIQHSREQLQDQSVSLTMASTEISATTIGPPIYPNTVVRQLQHQVYPVLPQDMVLEFTLNAECDLQVSLYGLHYSSHPSHVQKHLNEALQQTMALPTAHQTFGITGSHGTLEGFMQSAQTATFRLPFARYALYNINQALSTCLQLRDKLAVHSAVFSP